MRWIALLLLSCLLLSGCTAGDGVQGSATTIAGSSSASQGPGASSAASTPVAEPSPDAEHGSVAGVVTNDELTPVSGADVLLRLEQDMTARTDAEGRFTFNEVPPGTHPLAVDAIGYVSFSRSVDVLAGEVTQVQVVLEPIPMSEVRNETFIADAYFGLAVSVPGLFHSDLLGNSNEDFSYPVKPDVTAVISAAAWQSTTALTAKHMQLQVYTGSPRTCTASRAVCSQGVSPIHVRWDKVQDVVAGREGQVVGVSIMPVSCDSSTCPSRPADQWVQAAYDQRVRIYTSIFYVDPAPEGYLPLPPA